MGYFVYIIKSLSSGRYYIGQCRDLKNRISEHNQGRVRSTKAYIPWRLCYYEEYETRGEAMRRERELKAVKKRKYLEKIMGE